MITEGGNPPAGWIYVTWHPSKTDHTKIGYSKWHPYLPCVGYPNGYKRLHHLEFSLRAFGLGELEKWSSSFHANAKNIERQIRAELDHIRRRDVGKSREVFRIHPEDAKAVVRKYIPDA